MNKYIVSLILIALLSTGCGRGPTGASGPQGVAGIAGAQGPQGEQGETGPQGPAAILEVIDPCGDASGVVDEILLRLADGSVLCSFSANANGQNTRLAILPAGSYVTTDGSNCNFTVNANGTISY